jgi:hypothetical protein
MSDEKKAVKNIAHELHEMARELEEDIDLLANEEIIEELLKLESELKKGAKVKPIAS